MVENGVSLSVETIAHALVNIYKGNVDINHEIEEHLYQETSKIFHDAIAEGYANAVEEEIPLPDNEFREAILHSSDVFSAFRTHKMQNDIAAQLLNSKGQLKPFNQFVKDVSPYIEHRNRAWLQTEYNTAVIRAQNAAEWKMFEKDKDVYPNLEWIESTSTHPGEDHRIFWGTIRPVNDPFWDEHRPGDRWNCKCELRQSDSDVTAVPMSDGKSDPARGLESNPGKDKELFSQKHPYYPQSCMSCPFAGNKLAALFMDLKGKKNCHACTKVSALKLKVVARKKEYNAFGKEHKKDYFNKKNGGYLVTDKSRIKQAQSSRQEATVYNKEREMCLVFAKAGFAMRHRYTQYGNLTFDVFCNEKQADLKRTSSHNNIHKYASHAVKKQGAKIVLFQFDKFTPRIKSELRKLSREGIHGYYFITNKEETIHSF